MHLLADISSHGFGHLAQVAPVLRALARLRPGLRLTVRCALPRERLERRIGLPFRHLNEASDFGMVMRNAVDIDAEASAARYRDLHRDWAARVGAEAAGLRALAPDLVLANVAYLPLAGAAAAGIPAVAMCSLNWAGIVAGVLAGRAGMAEVHAQILDAYRSARMFIRFTPGMPMPDLHRVRPVGPVADPGRRRRDELDARLGLPAGERLALAAFGGVPLDLPLERWPRLPQLRWLVPDTWQPRRADAVAQEETGLPFADLLASCDAVVTKPGYGTFVESACCGLPVLYLRREGWAEERCLVEWLRENAVCAEVERERIERGDFGDALEALLALPRRPGVSAPGAGEAAALLAGLLDG